MLYNKIKSKIYMTSDNIVSTSKENNQFHLLFTKLLKLHCIKESK